MDLLTSVLVPVISAGAALFAILVAADQITAGARIRRWATFLREESAAAPSPYDMRVLDSLRRDADARLVARDAIPTKKFLFPVVMTVMVLFTWGLAGHIVADAALTKPSLILIARETSQETYFLLVLTFLGANIVWLQSGLPHIVARRRVAREYLQAEVVEAHPYPTDRLSTSSVDVWHVDKSLGWKGAGALAGSALGWCLISFGAGILLSSRPVPEAVVFLVFAPALGFVLALAGTTSVFLGLEACEPRLTWKHPRRSVGRQRYRRHIRTSSN